MATAQLPRLHKERHSSQNFFATQPKRIQSSKLSCFADKDDTDLRLNWPLFGFTACCSRPLPTINPCCHFEYLHVGFWHPFNFDEHPYGYIIAVTGLCNTKPAPTFSAGASTWKVLRYRKARALWFCHAPHCGTYKISYCGNCNIRLLSIVPQLPHMNYLLIQNSPRFLVLLMACSLLKLKICLPGIVNPADYFW